LLTKANGCQNHQNNIFLTSFGKKVGQFKRVHHAPVYNKIKPKAHTVIKQKVVAPKPLVSFMTNVNQGSYSLSVPHIQLTPIVVNVGRTGLGFTGCNTMSIPFISNANGAIKVNGQIASTSKSCAVNNDQKYVQLFLQADGYKHNGNNFFFTQKGNNLCQFNFINHQNKGGAKVHVKLPKVIKPIIPQPPINIITPPTIIPQPIHIAPPVIPHVVAPVAPKLPPAIHIIGPPVPRIVQPTINIVAPPTIVHVKTASHHKKQEH
jgi:hypothetical protein